MDSRTILLCHPSEWEAFDMRLAVERASSEARCAIATDLTETYNFVEHQHPACLIISHDLASAPEFELLSALLKQLQIGCILWGEPERHEPRAISSGYPQVSRTTSSVAFQRMLDAAFNTKRGSRGPLPVEDRVTSNDPNRIILLGASTGGVDALTRVLAHFSTNSPPTLIVQHTGGRFAPSLIRLLDRATSATVCVSTDAQQLQTGHIYLSPGDDVHLCLSKTGRRTIALDDAPPMSGHRPSVDMLFQSAVAHAPHVSAALLTGMGRDGAIGLKALRDAGARTFTQDQATSVVYGMPRIATEMGAATAQLPIDEIGPRLLGATRTRVTA